MNFISICSGIEAASVAFGPLGWKAVAFSEIEPFPCAVLAHHYPDVPNFGDMTDFRQWPEQIFESADAIVGGPPCQAFSVAGLRKGLDDARGNLTLTYAEMINHADAIRLRHGKPPVIVLYENVPGLLSDKSGAYGCFLAALAGEDDPLEPPGGGGWSHAGYVSGPQRTIAWRTFDAQYFGLPQRRRRVFVVASARDGFDPAAVLFEFDGVRRDIAPSRETGKAAAGGIGSSAEGGSWRDGGQLSQTLDAVLSKGQAMPEKNRFPAVLQPIAFPANLSATQYASTEELAPSMGAKNPTAVAYGFQPRIARNGRGDMGDVVAALSAQSGETGKGDAAPCVAVTHVTAMQVRRLTARECERLQGFQWQCSPDYPGAWQDDSGRWWSPDYTAIPWRKKPASECPDGPRYKSLGNSWAIPNVRWIGARIKDALQQHEGGQSD